MENFSNNSEEPKSRSELLQKVDDTMALLDLDPAVPENLSERIMLAQKEIQLPRVRRINLEAILQVAAAITLAVFIGHQFGKHSGIRSVKSQEQELVQYYKAHHFGMDNNTTPSSLNLRTNHE